MNLFGEVYLSIFVLFYKIGAGPWPKSFNANANSAALLIGFAEGMLAMAIVFALGLMRGHPVTLPKWELGSALTLLMLGNYYFLVARRHGLEFEKRFRHFPKAKQIALLSVATAIILAIIVLVAVVAKANRHAITGL